MALIHDRGWWAKYREDNRLWLRVYSKNWYHKTKERRRELMRDYRKRNREKIQQQQILNNKKRRMEILSMIGTKCVKCGFDDYRALHIDHVNGGGNKERKTHSHSWSYKFWKNALVERKEDYQVLCANCNWIKRYENKELYSWR